MKNDSRESETEWKGPAWKHPYVLYLLLTAGLFALVLLAALLALRSGVIPEAGS